MPRVDIAQISGFLSDNNQTIFTGSLVVSGSVVINSQSTGSTALIVTGSSYITGSMNINNLDTFGDKNSPDSIDLGSF